jgi:hypothetical protein
VASKNEVMQRIWHQYDSRREHKPSSMRQAAAWAVKDVNYTEDVAEREELERMRNRRDVA